MSVEYAVFVRKLLNEEGGGYFADVPDLPGCMSDGETPAEALENVEDAIGSWIEAAREDGRPIPEPSRPEDYSGKWLQRVPKSLHMRLAEQAKIEGVSLNMLTVTLLASGLGMKEGQRGVE